MRFDQVAIARTFAIDSRSALSVQHRFRARLGEGRFSCIDQAIDTTCDRKQF